MSSNKSRKKFGDLCMDNTTYIDYKDPRVKQYVSMHGRIKPRYYTKAPLVLQKRLARAIKNARYMGLIPFTK